MVNNPKRLYVNNVDHRHHRCVVVAAVVVSQYECILYSNIAELGLHHGYLYIRLQTTTNMNEQNKAMVFFRCRLLVNGFSIPVSGPTTTTTTTIVNNPCKFPTNPKNSH